MAFRRGTGSQALVAKGLATGRLRERYRNPRQQPTVDKIPDEKVIRLVDWENLPPWKQRGSEHLRTGYRPECASLWSCLHSWSYVHNETVNIFSHIIGALLFLALPLYVFRTEVPPRYKIATTADIMVCSVYFLGVGICFTFSTLFHTFMCHSEAVYEFGVKLDYQGILLLMWGANVPLIYYSLPCDSNGQMAYWTLNTVLAGMCSLATFHPSIGGPHLGHVRAALFATFGFCSVIAPNLIGVVKYGFDEQSQRVGLAWIGVTALCNGTGVVAYAMKFPERWYPRVFDLFGASHQVMHVMVVFAALTYTKAMLQAFDFHHEFSIACTEHI
ncbi:hemolysin-III channel protein-like protein Izh2 [Annulohypoxylon maeteangense]|uniref:hemolysin-III channel protein-like protein Izh2 n=1 Tax=Annulohypoxylon maeteangense TaxID=1927788 RepID=UPI002008E749|nr:hemolysin-III channel protein-like protein Izh2 [Annulohypoxylon maeteangense]KAI0883072.1 hemolysin-III channel protein-like protein Izh2 [Annulohypoxylon maeteangense]